MQKIGVLSSSRLDLIHKVPTTQLRVTFVSPIPCQTPEDCGCFHSASFFLLLLPLWNSKLAHLIAQTIYYGSSLWMSLNVIFSVQAFPIMCMNNQSFFTYNLIYIVMLSGWITFNSRIYACLFLLLYMLSFLGKVSILPSLKDEIQEYSLPLKYLWNE